MSRKLIPYSLFFLPHNVKYSSPRAFQNRINRKTWICDKISYVGVFWRRACLFWDPRSPNFCKLLNYIMDVLKFLPRQKLKWNCSEYTLETYITFNESDGHGHWLHKYTLPCNWMLGYGEIHHWCKKVQFGSILHSARAQKMGGHSLSGEIRQPHRGTGLGLLLLHIQILCDFLTWHLNICVIFSLHLPQSCEAAVSSALLVWSAACCHIG